MNRITNINLDRLKWCFQDAGVAVSDVASELKIPKLNEVILAESDLTFNQLKKISDFFGRGVLFFLDEAAVNIAKVHTPQFRTITNIKPNLSPKTRALIERVEKQRSIFLTLSEDFDDSEKQSFSPPSLPDNNIKKAADVIRLWLQLGEKNDFNSYRAAIERKGVLVFRSNGYNGKWQVEADSLLLGFGLYDQYCPIIFIKKTSENQQSFTLMHELAHILIHQITSVDEEADIYSSQAQDQEKEANAFAGYLLVPDRFLAEISDIERPKEVFEYDQWLKSFSDKWGVSSEVILRRLLESERLSRRAYQAYRNWRATLNFPISTGGTRTYRYREPKHIFGNSFVRTVLKAKSMGSISLTKASTYLDNLKIKDLHQLEDYYARI